MKIYLTTKEAAEYMRYSEQTLENWRVSGCGPKWHKPENKVLYKKDDIDQWIEGKNNEQ